MNSRIVEKHVTALKTMLKPANLGVLTRLSRDTLVGNQARVRDIFQQHSVAEIHYTVDEEEAFENAEDVSDMLTAISLLTTPEHLRYLEQAPEDAFDHRQKMIVRDILAAFAPGINPSSTVVGSSFKAFGPKASTSKAFTSKVSSNKDSRARTLGSSAAETNAPNTVKRKRPHVDDDTALRRSTRAKAPGPEDGETPRRKGEAPNLQPEASSKPLSTPTWAVLRHLQELELHPVLALHIRTNPGCSPRLFLDDVDRLLHKGAKTPQISDQLQGITALYIYNKRSSDRSWLIHARFLFVILFFGDYADQVLGEKGRLSKGKAHAMVDAYYHTHHQDNTTTTAKKRGDLVDEMVSHVPNYIKWGKRLVHLCNLFTTGSLFWLCPQLTEAFLGRMTLSGAPHDAGVENLTRLRLQKKARDSGAERLGDGVRNHLAETFGLERRRDEGEEDEEEAGEDGMEVDEELA